MGKEQEKFENQQEEALATIKRLGILLLTYRKLSKSPKIPKGWKEIFGIFGEDAQEKIKIIRNQFFPDKTLREIISEPNEPLKGSKTAF